MNREELLTQYIHKNFMPYSTLQEDKYFRKQVSNTLDFNLYVLKSALKNLGKAIIRRK